MIKKHLYVIPIQKFSLMKLCCDLKNFALMQLINGRNSITETIKNDF